jgi:hypothetical protein
MTDQYPAPQGQPQHNPYQASAPQGGYGGAKPRNSLALVALILGIAGFFTGGLASIGAIIVGHISLSQIKKTGEEGRPMALWGTILGYVAIALWILAGILFVAFAAAIFNSPEFQNQYSGY